MQDKEVGLQSQQFIHVTAAGKGLTTLTFILPRKFELNQQLRTHIMLVMVLPQKEINANPWIRNFTSIKLTLIFKIRVNFIDFKT